jgi:hypothetical protein
MQGKTDMKFRILAEEAGYTFDERKIDLSEESSYQGGKYGIIVLSHEEVIWQMTTIPSKEFQFTSTDGLRIACTRWDSHGPARGIVQIALTIALVSAPVLAQSDSWRAADCSNHARDRAETEMPRSGGALGGVASGVARGELFGAIVDGGKVAGGHGAALGGGLGAVGLDRLHRTSKHATSINYDECIRDRTLAALISPAAGGSSKSYYRQM